MIFVNISDSIEVFWKKVHQFSIFFVNGAKQLCHDISTEEKKSTELATVHALSQNIAKQAVWVSLALPKIYKNSEIWIPFYTATLVGRSKQHAQSVKKRATNKSDSGLIGEKWPESN